MASCNHQDMQEKVVVEMLYTLVNTTRGDSIETPDPARVDYLTKAVGCSPEAMQASLDNAKNLKPPVYQAHVSLEGATRLKNKSIGGPSVLYVLLGLVGQAPRQGSADTCAEACVQRSSLSEGPHPTWKEKFTCDLDKGGSQSLVLSVWNHQSVNSLPRMLTKLSSPRCLYNSVKQAVRRDDPTVGKLSRQDHFLGQVSLPLQDVPLRASEQWLKLEPRSQRSQVSGEIGITLSLVTCQRDTPMSRQGLAKVDIFEKILSIFVEYEHRIVAGGWLAGLSADAMHLLSLYAAQTDVSCFQQSMTVWLKFSRMHGCGRRVEFSVLLAAFIDLEANWDALRAYERAVELLDSVQQFVGQCLRMLEDISSNFPSDNPSSIGRLTNLLKCICLVYKSRVCQSQQLPCSDHKAAVIAAVKRGIEDKYLNWKQSMQNVPEDLVRMLTLTKEVVGAIRLLCDNYSQVFARECDVNFDLVIYQQAGDLLGPDVRAVMRGVSGTLSNTSSTSSTSSSSTTTSSSSTSSSTSSATSSHMAEMTLRLYLVLLTLRSHTESLRAATDGVEQQQEDTTPPGVLHCLHEWFSGVFWSWFDVVGSKVLAVMEQAVEADTLRPEMIGVKHSCSAVDSAKCFQDFCELWQQLQWPHPTKTLSKIMDGISKSALAYAQLVSRKLGRLGGGGETVASTCRRRSILGDIGGGNAADRVPAETVPTLAQLYCIAVNNVGLVWSSLSALPEQWPWAGLSGHEVQMARRMLHAQLRDTEQRLHDTTSDMLHRLRDTIQTVTRRNLLALGASTSNGSEQALEALTDFLNNTIRVLFETLAQEPFQRLLEELWSGTVRVMADIVSEKKPRSVEFFSRMHLALQALLDIYHPGDGGLPPTSLELKEYVELDRELRLKKTLTQDLVGQYLVRRCDEQTSERSSLGTVAVRCFYDPTRQQLVLEILNIALPGAGERGQLRLVAKVRLLPRSLFGDIKGRSTRPGERGTHVLVDEALCFKVSREQCASPGATALCSVRSHAALRGGIVGEAAVRLAGLPGVVDGGAQPPADPRAVPQISLRLLHPRPGQAEAEILSVLQARTQDSEAQDFVKTSRNAESQCLHTASGL